MQISNVSRGISWKAALSIVAMILLVCSGSLRAQGLGSISGKVSDSSGATIPNATVTATQVKTGASSTATTNDQGVYVFPSLAPNDYSLSVAAQGFQKYVQTGITLQADQAATVDAQLKVGSESESITVSANASAVDTNTGTLAQVINEQSVNDLPLNARNAASLTLLVPGVVSAPNEGADQGNTKTFPVAVTIAANGSRANATNFLLDGGNNVDEYTNVNAPFPFPDALQEFSVQTSNYNAEYGQNAGAVVNIITKSGGNEYHGDAFEYLRNRVFNARNYFATAVDPQKRHQFGVTIGGPVKIPHISSGAHTFFFFGYQGTILRDVVGGKSAFIPTQANLLGDFSAYGSPVYDPATGLPLAGNRIDPTRFDKAALAVMSHLPAATGTGQVTYAQPTNEKFDEYVARVDQEIGTKDRLTARYYYNNFALDAVFDPTNLLNYADGSDIRYQNSLLSETHTFTNNLLNNLIVNYQREISSRGPAPNSFNMTDLGVQNIFQPASKAIQSIAATGFFSIGANPHAEFQRNNYTLGDDLHWVHGRHNIAVGVHAELSKADINSDNTEPGTFTFNNNVPGHTGVSTDALANFLLGSLYQFGQGMGQYLNNRNTFIGFYAQDAWKPTNRLTLNYGVRYEPFFPWNEIKNRITLFSPAAYAANQVSTIFTNAPKGMLFPGDPGMPQHGVRNVYSNIMPRLGFAYDVFGNGKTSIRGGAGSFYETRQSAIFNSGQTNNSPFSISENLTQPAGPFSNPYLGIPNPFPTSIYPASNVVFPSPTKVYTPDPSGTYKVPVIYDWNLTFEQQITPSLSSRVAYVGSHASHLLVGLELNPSVYIPGSSLSTNARRLFQGYTNISEAHMEGDEAYHSLQASLQERMGRKLTVTASYTYSKALDNLPYGSNDLDGPPSGQSYVKPYTVANYKSLDYGPSDFDRRHVFTASYAWMLPKLATGSAVLRAIVNDWQTSGIITAESGNPITVTAGSTDYSGTGLLQDRAVVVPNVSPLASGSCSTTKSCVTYLNAKAFTAPAIGTYGNFQKDSLVGPRFINWDTSLMRDFHIYRESKLQFRADYFDVLNHTNFLLPSTALGTAAFGTITSSNDPRIAQLALKVLF
jgi:hypothetical protein